MYVMKGPRKETCLKDTEMLWKVIMYHHQLLGCVDKALNTSPNISIPFYIQAPIGS